MSGKPGTIRWISSMTGPMSAVTSSSEMPSRSDERLSVAEPSKDTGTGDTAAS